MVGQKTKQKNYRNRPEKSFRKSEKPSQRSKIKLLKENISELLITSAAKSM